MTFALNKAEGNQVGPGQLAAGFVLFEAGGAQFGSGPAKKVVEPAEE